MMVDLPKLPEPKVISRPPLPEVPPLKDVYEIFRVTNEKPKHYRRSARPWDLFNKNIEKVSEEIKEERMAICRECPFLKFTGQCSKCGCFMDSKTKLPNASCPIGKWDEVPFDSNTVDYKKVKE
jgi:hypothetical protein